MKNMILLILLSGFVASFAGNSSLQTLHDRVFKISSGKDLVISTETGDIIVTAWDKEEVHVKIVGNSTAREKLVFKFNSNSNKVEVIGKREGSGWSWFSNVKVKYEVMVPSSFNVKIATAGGDIKLGGINGELLLKTSGGDIWTDRCSGKLDLKTSGGDLNIFTSNTEVQAKTSGGDIKLEYTGANKGIELKTSGGDIDIRVPYGFSATIDATTSGGDVSCDHQLSNKAKSSKNKLKADMNGGGSSLVARTSGGDIDIRVLK